MNEFTRNTILPLIVVFGVFVSCIVSICLYNCYKYIGEIATITKYERLESAKDEEEQEKYKGGVEIAPRKPSIKRKTSHVRSLALLPMIPEVDETGGVVSLRESLRLRDIVINAIYNHDRGYVQVTVNKIMFCPLPEDYSPTYSVQYTLSFSLEDIEDFESEIRPLRENIRFDETYRIYVPVTVSDGAGMVCKVNLMERQFKRTLLWDIKYNLKASLILSSSDPGTMSEDPEILSVTERVAKVDLVQELIDYRERPKLLIGLCYKPTSGRIIVRVIEGADIPVSAHQMRIRVALVQTKYGSVRSFTSPVMENESNPVINENFTLGIAIKNIQSTVLIVMLMYGFHGKTFAPVAETKIGSLVSKEDARQHWNDMLSSTREDVQSWHTLS